MSAILTAKLAQLEADLEQCHADAVALVALVEGEEYSDANQAIRNLEDAASNAAWYARRACDAHGVDWKASRVGVVR